MKSFVFAVIALCTTSTLYSQEHLEKEILIVQDVDKQAEFPGGNKALFSFVADELKYPEKGMKNNVEGKVYVSFVVLANGELSEIKILRGIDSEFNEEVTRVINAMPKWNPAEKNGQPVNMQMTLPIVFEL